MFKLLDSFCDYLLHEKRYSKHTVTSYRTDIGQFLKYCIDEYEVKQIKRIKHSFIRSWMVELMSQDIVAKSITRKISSLRSFFNYLKRTGKLKTSPMLKIIAPKVPKRLPEFVRAENIDQLLDTMVESQDYPSARNRMIIEMFYSTGIRRAELIEIKSKDINFSDQQLKVLGKGGKERIIPLSANLMKKLKTLLEFKDEHFDRNEEFLFLTDKGKKMYPKFVYNLVTKLLGSVSTNKKKSPHILRHSFATHLTNNGADINAIKELLGHANLAATQIYTHNSIKKLQEVYSKAHPKAKKG